MQFQSIIGQQEIKKQLVEMIQHNRLSHALLFLSKEGSGGISLALALAQYITCEKANNKSQATIFNSSLFGEELKTQSSHLTA
jgi:DNA polymerase-3 subunit delta'